MKCPNPDCKDMVLFLDKYDDTKATFKCWACDGKFMVDCPDQQKLVKLIQEK